jgi:hypothetical protein
MPREIIKARKPAKEPAIAAKVAVTAAAKESGDARTATRSAPVDAASRRALIAEAAYYRSLRQVGSELDHWLAAEQEIDAQLMKPSRA